MTRSLVATLLVLSLAASAEAQRSRASQPSTPSVATAPAGAPAPGLGRTDLTSFNDGRAEFTEVESVTDGLGPVFNDRSCVACHDQPAPGGGSPRLVTRIGTRSGGVFSDLSQFGGSLLQARGLGPQDGVAHVFRPEIVPQAATIVVQRRSTPIFGLGLVDATPDSTFVALAAMERALDPSTAGRVSMVDNISAGMKTVGKFGWKAQVPSLFQFAGDAYVNELGITNPLFPNENCPSGNCSELSFNPAPGLNDDGTGVRKLAAFMSLLAAPQRGTITADVTAGERVFERIGCDSCHTATIVSSKGAYHPYSDFLLHNMGALADNLDQGAATGAEMRTAPLWGLRFINRFLHDGRATTLDAAITAHDGQARAARDNFAALNADERAKLMAFLRSL